MLHKKVWEYWKKFGRILGKIQTTIILSIIYYIVITPFGLLKLLFSRKKKTGTYWLDIQAQKHNLKESFNQY